MSQQQHIVIPHISVSNFSNSNWTSTLCKCYPLIKSSSAWNKKFTDIADKSEKSLETANGALELVSESPVYWLEEPYY